MQVPLSSWYVVHVAGEQAIASRRSTVGAVVGVREPEHRRAEQLVLGAPEHLRERAVDLEEAAVERDERHADRRVVERVAEPLLRLAQLALRPVALGRCHAR